MRKPVKDDSKVITRTKSKRFFSYFCDSVYVHVCSPEIKHLRYLSGTVFGHEVNNSALENFSTPPNP